MKRTLVIVIEVEDQDVDLSTLDPEHLTDAILLDQAPVEDWAIASAFWQDVDPHTDEFGDRV